MPYHVPVLLRECINALNIDPVGVYVDATFGGGGHAHEMLKKLTSGKLVAFDQDVEAKKNISEDGRVIFIHQNFKYLKKYLKLYNLIPVHGILADLGVSSHQFDTPERGFSTRFDAVLDMRMDQSSELTARDILNTYDERQLQNMFSSYGEVRNAKTLAKKIVEARRSLVFKTIEQLKEIIHPVVLGNPHKYLAQVFQALRIEVNGELDALRELLEQSAEILKPQGRLVVISYHSLEDRLVKNFIKTGSVSGEIESDIYGNCEVPFKGINKKPITPKDDEVKRNSRARSAKLRIAEKI